MNNRQENEANSVAPKARSFANPHPNSPGMPIGQVLGVAEAEIATMNLHPDAGGLNTGIASIDRHCKMAAVPGALITIAGESGGGKTAFMTQLAASYSTQAPVYVFSLEDETSDSVKRALANVGRLSVGKLRTGFPGEDIPLMFDNTIKELGGKDIYYDPNETLNIIGVISNMIKHWKACDQQFVVFLIDQLSNISPLRGTDEELAWLQAAGIPLPPRSGSSQAQHVEWTARALRVAARRMRACVILAVQLNNNHAKGEKPDMRSIRESQGIVHESSLVLIVWLPKTLRVELPDAGPGQPKFEERPNIDGDAWLICAKGRRVQVFEERLRFLGAFQCFVDPRAESIDFTFPKARSESGRRGMDILTAIAERFDATRVEKVLGEEAKQIEASTDPEIPLPTDDEMDAIR